VAGAGACAAAVIVVAAKATAIMVDNSLLMSFLLGSNSVVVPKNIFRTLN
jgi:hypothetical protein